LALKLQPESPDWQPFLLSAEAHAATPGYIIEAEKALAPAGTAAVVPLVAKLAVACKHAGGDTLDRKAQAALLAEYLGGQPADAVAWAVDRWIKTQIFFPTISELLALCEERKAQIRCVKIRLERLMAHRAAAENSRAAAAEIDEGKRAELDRKFKAAMAHLASASPPSPARPRTIFKPISDEALARIRKGAGQ
jgi:hypothetical protein